ncbi:unnamed protein product [Protopolystoma xenopodis]|uniref:FRAS1-related extracellular matrix protein N-terminal domain-containing protein n=1 Tax=Protopolystoma xenopodis TaxID=117903 RepID=A0A3S5AW31_9PLAT|nr:unnamed protein product [Protopolystoma xenopodis]
MQKFPCNFKDGEVTYHHEGNPLTNTDRVQLSIFFFRNNLSVVHTLDLVVEVVDPLPQVPGSLALQPIGWLRRDGPNRTVNRRNRAAERLVSVQVDPPWLNTTTSRKQMNLYVLNVSQQKGVITLLSI